MILEVSCGSAESEYMSLLEIRCIYKDPVTNEIVPVESEEVSIKRAMKREDVVVSVEVERQLNRHRASQAMSEARALADGGELSEEVRILRDRDRDRERDLSETVQ